MCADCSLAFRIGSERGLFFTNHIRVALSAFAQNACGNGLKNVEANSAAPTFSSKNEATMGFTVLGTPRGPLRNPEEVVCVMPTT